MLRGGAAIVPFAPRHGGDVLRVIGSVFREYGATFEPAGFDADLTDIGRRYLEAGGCFAVLEDAGQLVGTVAAIPHDGATCEIKRLYLLPEYRGRGLGRALMEHVLGWAQTTGYRVALAWSDTRFTTAHRVYERLGFERCGERTLDDADRSREYGFRRALAPGAPGPPSGAA
jgi:GNAT superfamily N-acetyltransferase